MQTVEVGAGVVVEVLVSAVGLAEMVGAKGVVLGGRVGVYVAAWPDVGVLTCVIVAALV